MIARDLFITQRKKTNKNLLRYLLHNMWIKLSPNGIWYHQAFISPNLCRPPCFLCL